MEAPRIGNLPLVGGHRALDLVNTVTPRQPAAEREDHLRVPDDLITWSRRTGLIDAETSDAVAVAWDSAPPAGRRALAAVKEIREAVYEVLLACLAGQDLEMARDELDHVSLAWASAVTRARLRPAGGGTGAARLAVESPPALLITDLVAQDAIDLLCGTDVTRLGCCPVESGGCGWMFVDHSRNHSRQWCTMEHCGTEAKSRRLTERRRLSRAASRNHRPSTTIAYYSGHAGSGDLP